MISKEEYIDYAGKGFNLVPIIKELEIDSDSPITLYSKIKNKSNTFLLESIEGGIKWAQYSIIGLDCTDSIKISDNFIEISENYLILCAIIWFPEAMLNGMAITLMITYRPHWVKTFYDKDYLDS